MFKPSMGTLANVACLTASSDLNATPVPGCADPATDPSGSGVLLLTPADNTKVGSVTADNTLPASFGLDVAFNTYQWGGTSADGIGFVLAAVDPNTQVPSAVGGPAGGSLGYSANTDSGSNKEGYANGYLGIGFDVHGNYLNPEYQGTGCTNQSWQPASGGTKPNEITVRGPGNGMVGYCALESTANPALALTQPVMHASTQAASKVPAQITINPTAESLTNSIGQVVPARSYRVSFTGAGQSAQSFTGALPSAAGLVPSSWLDSQGIPLQLAFGWTASTGGATDNHAIDASLSTTLTELPTLKTTQKYAGTRIAKPTFTVRTSSPLVKTVTSDKSTKKYCKAGSRGDNNRSTCVSTLTYTTKVSNAALDSKVRIVGDLPAKLKAVKVTSAKGWSCKKKSSAQIECTTRASKFKKNQKLSPVVVKVKKR